MASEMKRTLPIRVEPIPGEALDSWLAALATRMRCSWGEILDSVLPSPNRDAFASAHGALTAELTHLERCAIATATDTTPAELDAMTLAGTYGGHIVTLHPVTRCARTPWGPVRRQRFCPLCVTSKPGRYQLEWRLPWITVCRRHQCLLVDECPKCGQFQWVSPYWFDRTMHPIPDRCRRPIPGIGEGTRCAALLAEAEVDMLPDDHPALTAQQTLCQLVTQKSIDLGFYRTAPVTPNQLLTDVHLWFPRNRGGFPMPLPAWSWIP
jgi:hypothetical protein